jgi:UDP-N-acetyl-D-glucosamine dehydrogenase
MNGQVQGVLAIIGQGYVGLPLAMAAIDAGWSVIGVDNSQVKVAQINRGISPVEDVSDTKLQYALSTGLYKVTTDFSFVSTASVVTICVPTPLDENREPDLSYLKNAATSIAPFISDDSLVVSESTSYPGTLREVIIPIIMRDKSAVTNILYFACAPERVNPGDFKWNQKNTPRLVGAINKESQKRALAFYESICDAAISVSTPEIAEAAKLLENTFRLVNIALVNELTQICSSSGINVQEVIDAASTKPYGFMPFRPSVGVGGHCIPVDPLYLTWWARQKGGRASFVEAADVVNQFMPKYVAERALGLINRSVKKPKVLILGVAYKPGVSDVRETPASELLIHLVAGGAEVAWHDPLVSIWDGTMPVDLDWECDVAILATKQPGMNLSKLIDRGIRILDCTNTFTSKAGVTAL